MSDNISKARERLERIKSFYEYADPTNRYSQSLYYYKELVNIYKKAKSNEQSIIREFYNEADRLMEEMKTS